MMRPTRKLHEIGQSIWLDTPEGVDSTLRHLQ
jgi:hypothetical protein